MIITFYDVLGAMAKEPCLGAGGFYPNPEDASQNSLIDRLDEVQICANWLDAQSIGAHHFMQNLHQFDLTGRARLLAKMVADNVCKKSLMFDNRPNSNRNPLTYFVE
jgi:hypothetical protein